MAQQPATLARSEDAPGRALIAARCQSIADLCRAPRAVGILQLLLDDGPGLFCDDLPFSEGARVSHFSKRLSEVMSPAPRDRELIRDHLVRPLRALGALELVTWKGGHFVPGHQAKSPNSSYRLTRELRDLLEHPEEDFDQALETWVSGSRQRRIAAIPTGNDSTGHASLIATACDRLASYHIPGFRPIFIDDADGDRVSEHEAQALAALGFDLQLDDAYPDAILYNDDESAVWFVEAVTSDGEIDHVKLEALRTMAERWGVTMAGATTCYANWQYFLRRKAKGAQIAWDTSVWIADEPGLLMRIEAAKTI